MLDTGEMGLQGLALLGEGQALDAFVVVVPAHVHVTLLGQGLQRFVNGLLGEAHGFHQLIDAEVVVAVDEEQQTVMDTGQAIGLEDGVGFRDQAAKGEMEGLQGGVQVFGGKALCHHRLTVSIG